MDVGLGLGLGDSILTLVEKVSLSADVMESEAESPRARCANSPRGRNADSPRGRVADSPRGKSFSWSFITRHSNSAPSPSRDAIETMSTTSQSSADSTCDSSSSGSSSVAGGSEPSPGSPKCSSPRSKFIRSLFSSSKPKWTRKPVLLDRMPFGKRSEYLTLYVGVRTEQSEKFIVSRRLLAHPLFRVLMQCSEDELGEDYEFKSGVAIVCDPALFLEVVKAVDDEMWSAQMAQAGEQGDKCEEVDVRETSPQQFS